MIKLLYGKALLFAFATFTLLSTSQVYSQTKALENLPAGSIKLVYNYPSDMSVKYRVEGKIVQDMDINGQSMLVNVSTFVGCDIKSTGVQNDNVTIEVKIDTMAQNIDSPQGTAGGPIIDIKDKTFNMVITSAGKIIDLSEASKISISIPGSGESDASMTFSDFFPVLPAMAVKPGDTWITHDTADIKGETMTRWMPVESNNKFEGIEEYNGFECAKITSDLSGSMKITNQAQGMSIYTNGTYTGSRTLLFAVKEGYFVQETVKTKLTGTVEIADQGMSFPLVMDITTSTELVK
jgi:hypothetical protein